MAHTEFIDSDWEACPAVAEQTEICYGDPTVSGRQDGGDVLDTLGNVFALVSSDNTLLEDVGACFAIALVLKVAYMILLNVLVSKSSKVVSSKRIA